MSRYIDEDKLIEELKEEIDFETSMYTEEQNKYFEMGLRCAIRDVKSQPTADVVEVRHGKSISEMHYSDEFICSECGLIMRECCRYEIDEDADGDESCYGFEFKYCPNCGAKMDGERREENEG